MRSEFVSLVFAAAEEAALVALDLLVFVAVVVVVVVVVVISANSLSVDNGGDMFSTPPSSGLLGGSLDVIIRLRIVASYSCT